MSYDIHFESVQQQGGTVTDFHVLTFGDYPQTVRIDGIQKLVNRFLKCLMTPAGTDLSDPRYGTGLMTMFLGNVDQNTIGQVVTLSVNAAVKTIQDYDLANAAPDTERLMTASIERLDFDSTSPGFDLYLRLTNVAGTTVILLVPDMKEFTG